MLDALKKINIRWIWLSWWQLKHYFLESRWFISSLLIFFLWWIYTNIKFKKWLWVLLLARVFLSQWGALLLCLLLQLDWHVIIKKNTSFVIFSIVISSSYLFWTLSILHLIISINSQIHIFIVFLLCFLASRLHMRTFQEHIINLTR